MKTFTGHLLFVLIACLLPLAAGRLAREAPTAEPDPKPAPKVRPAVKEQRCPCKTKAGTPCDCAVSHDCDCGGTCLCEHAGGCPGRKVVRIEVVTDKAEKPTCGCKTCDCCKACPGKKKDKEGK